MAVTGQAPASLPDHRLLIERIAGATASRSYKAWGFGESIAMEGLLATSGAPRDFARSLILEWARTAGPLDRDPLAHVAPGVPLLTLVEQTGEPMLWQRAWELAHVLAAMRRGRAGARLHRPDLAGWEHEIWVDCMHLDGPFLARLGVLAHDSASLDLAVELVLGHARVLQDEATGLFCHGFDDATGRANGVHWGRGQGWALLGLVDTLRLLPANQPGRGEVQHRLWAVIAALAATEIEPGSWATVVDHPETYREASISAFVSLGVGRAIRHQCAAASHRPLADRAWDATTRYLTPAGQLTGVSDATPVGRTVPHYGSRPHGTAPWGQGAALLAALERTMDEV